MARRTISPARSWGSRSRGPLEASAPSRRIATIGGFMAGSEKPYHALRFSEAHSEAPSEAPSLTGPKRRSMFDLAPIDGSLPVARLEPLADGEADPPCPRHHPGGRVPPLHL